MCEKYLYDLATDKVNGGIAVMLKPVLAVFSLLYGLIVLISRFAACISSRKLGCGVISVGNITLGGTGKTVIVEFICRYLKEKGRKVAVLTRGYARPRQAPGDLLAGYEKMGDEPYMLQAKLPDVPILVSPDRFKSADRAVNEFKADTAVLDDGFQQWRIKKDLEIAAIDAANPFGNGMLIPRGILREPVSSLRRADVLILTNTDLAGDMTALKRRLGRIAPYALIIESAHYPEGFYRIQERDVLLPVDSLRSKTAAMACAIGNPASFQGLLEKIGVRLGLTVIFPDHYRYTQNDLEKIAAQAGAKGIKTLVVTEKDAVKIAKLDLLKSGLDILVLQIRLRINENEQRFFDRLLGVHTF